MQSKNFIQADIYLLYFEGAEARRPKLVVWSTNVPLAFREGTDSLFSGSGAI
jgi:hypothetical protein